MSTCHGPAKLTTKGWVHDPPLTIDTPTPHDPVLVPEIELRPGDRWASFGREYHETASSYRHITTPGKPTSACGTTALPADLWRKNSTKPPCPSCLTAEARRRPTPTPTPETSPRPTDPEALALWKVANFTHHYGGTMPAPTPQESPQMATYEVTVKTSGREVYRTFAESQEAAEATPLDEMHLVVSEVLDTEVDTVREVDEE